MAGNNKRLTEYLIKRGAKIFYEPIRFRDNSPFFQAIVSESIWAIEMFCDHGADCNTRSSSGKNPIIHAAQNKFDEIAMYISLRCEDVDQEDRDTGHNALVIYLLREDLARSQQLIMRGANINFPSSKEGSTPLHYAVKNGVSSETIRFLLKSGADPHLEDVFGKDVCDLVK